MAFEGLGSRRAAAGASGQARKRMLRVNGSLLALSALAASIQGACTLISPSDGTYLGGVAAAGGKAGSNAQGGSAGNAGNVSGGTGGNATGGDSGSGGSSAGMSGSAGSGGAIVGGPQYKSFDVSASSGLTDYQVNFVLDTRALIQSGTLDAQCVNIQALGQKSKGCDLPLPAWVTPGTCNTANTEIWVKAPTLSFGKVRFNVLFGSAPNTAKPADVFQFFDDFDGTSLDTGAWTALPTGSKAITLKDGLLSSTGASALQSKAGAAVLKPGQNVFGVRLLASDTGAQLELAAGAVSPTSSPLDSDNRLWNGLGIKNNATSGFSEGTLPNKLDPGTGTACNDAKNNGNLFTGSTSLWSYGSAASAKYQVAEFGYDQKSGASIGSISTSKGYKASWTIGPACKTPATLPILIVLDEATAASGDTDPTQVIDYVYVRQITTPTPPTISVAAASMGTDCGPQAN